MSIIVRKSARYPFRLVERLYRPIKTERVIPRESFIALGFDPNMSYEDAVKRARQLTEQKEIERKK